ncbi:CPBP family intramembrane glutamic endopeptidase [Pontibacter toksunensis]|uniref:CPBP family intramembrane glutamic endopeptidase n=1 Tax=Pontibacter toksunensis TaxID=1332631 RepID=A0ABW6BU08_9BACT
MKNKIAFILWILAFMVLNLYVKLTPRFLQQDNVSHWINYWLTFFGIAFLIARFVLRFQGLQSFGLRLHQGWYQNLTVGFLLGAGVYSLKYLLCYGAGMFDVAGTTDMSFITVLLAQALLAMLFSSAINDVMNRGYWLPYLRKEHLMKWYLLFVTVLYVLDDSWNEGLKVENLAFSVVLGLTFAYTVLKTGSIWMSIGLHWGGNVLFRMMYGFDGQGVWRLENVQDGPLFDYISLAVTALMFPLVFMVLKSRFINKDKIIEVEGAALSAKVA